MKPDFSDFADGGREVLRARLNLSRHALGNRVYDVLLRFEHVADRVLQSIFTFVSHEAKKRWRDRNDNELAERRSVEHTLAAEGRNESDGTWNHRSHQKFVAIGLGEARKVELRIIRMNHGRHFSCPVELLLTIGGSLLPQQ